MSSTKRRAATVALAVIGSRIMGLVREIVFVGMFGRFYDVFLGAFQIPNLLRDLFAEGALSTAFTSVFTKTWDKEGEAKAWHLASLVISTLLLLMGIIVVIGIICSPWIVDITNEGFKNIPGKYELTVVMTRLLFPFIVMVSVAAVVMGMLNARFIFGIPASASTAFNIVSVISGVAFAFIIDPQADWRHPHFSEKALYGVAAGVLLGGVAQLGIQLPSLWRLGFRYRWNIDFTDPIFKQVLMLMIPSIIAGAAVQVNVLVNGYFASHIDGGRTWLNSAFRLMQFPIGVFGVAIATVTLPAVALQQARDNLKSVGESIRESLRLGLALTLPAAFGLAAVAEPLIRCIYENGRFTAEDTLFTAQALQAYVIGLSAYACIKILVPCFYALNEPNTPLRISIIGIILNLVLNKILITYFGLGHVGLAITTSCVALINFTQLIVALRKKVDFGSTEWISYFIKILGASILAAGAAKGVVQLVGSGSFGRDAIGLFSGIIAAVLVYGSVTWLLGIDEIRKVVSGISKRLEKKNS